MLIKFLYRQFLKKNNNFLGINKFNLLSKLSYKEIVALGGISKDNFGLINLTKSSSVAGISFFK